MPSTNPKNDFNVFARYFLLNALVIWQILVGLLVLIVTLGILISVIEELRLGEGIYFAFITALTIGYGDINAVTVPGRALCVLTGIVGMLFTGIVVAVATRALHDTIDEQRALEITHGKK